MVSIINAVMSTIVTLHMFSFGGPTYKKHHNPICIHTAIRIDHTFGSVTIYFPCG